MDIGITSFLTDYGIDPRVLARGVEERGFAALFLTEHTHIPASRETPWPGGAELPRSYSHLFDPFVALGAMAAVTDRLVLGTAVTLVNQHHPINLAKQVASVERLAPGRVQLGVGPGWNIEEMVNHGIDPRRRTAQMLERLAAMRAIWTQDQAEFHGEYVDFDPIWCWPKPANPLPVLIGGTGPKVIDRVLSHGDGWLPIRVKIDELDALAGRIDDLRARAAELGRARPTVTVFGAVPDAAVLTEYAGAGVDRVLFTLTEQDGADTTASTLAELDRLAELT